MTSFVLIFISLAARAEFVFDKNSQSPNRCILTNKFSGITSDNISYEGRLNISFTNSEATLLLISVGRVSRSINPTNMSLSWSEMDILDSKERPIFYPDVQQRVATEENKIYELTQETEGDFSTFFSRPYGFYRFQNFIALFLSQKYITLNFTNGNNKESLNIDLSGSDMIFREFARECYPAQVENYVFADNTRVTTVPIHYLWSIGYGLNINFNLEEQLPEQVKFPNDILDFLSKDSRQSYTQFEELVHLLKNKSKLNEEILEIELNKDFNESQNTVRESYKTLLALSESKKAIDGPTGELKMIENQLSELEIKIKNAQDYLSVHEEKIKPFESKKNILDKKIQELKQNLNLIEQRITTASILNKEFLNKIEQLQDIIKSYAQEYELKITESLKLEVLKTPYSIETIVQVNEELKQNQILMLDAQKNLNFLSSINLQLDEILKAYNELSEHQNTRNDKVVEIVNLENALNTNTLEWHSLQNALGRLSFEKISEYINSEITSPNLNQNSNKETETGNVSANNIELVAEVKVSDAFSNVKKNIEIHYEKYNSLVDSQRDQFKKLLFLRVICKTDVLLPKFQGQCLNPIYLNDVKKVQLWFEELDSATVTELSSLIVDKSVIYDRFKNNDIDGLRSLTEVMSEQIVAESELDQALAIKELWNKILYYRWKFLSIRPLNQTDDYRPQVLTELLNRQIAVINKIKETQAEQSSKLTQLQAEVRSLDINKRAAEDLYFSTLQSNQSFIMNEINSSQISLADLNLQCLLDVIDITACSEKYSLILSEKRNLKDELSKKIDKAIIFLMVTATSEIETLSENLAKNNKAIEMLLLEKNNFIETNNYYSSLYEHEMSIQDVRRLKMRLKQYLEQKADSYQKRSLLFIEESKSNKNLQDLITQIDSITAEIKPVLIVLQPLCQRIQTLLEQYEANENQIYKVLSLPAPNLNRNSICQIKF